MGSSLKKTVAAVAGVALALSSAPALVWSAPRAAAQGGSRTSVVSADEQAFALDLLRRLGAGATNLVMSPSSLAALLSMLEPGAAGSTQAGIAEATHSEGMTAEGQAAGWHSLDAVLAADARYGHITLETANEAWLQDGLPVRKDYLGLLERDFAAGVRVADLLHDPGAAATAIDDWVASRTEGHITHLVNASELQKTVAVLVDAVYMDAPWEKAFPASLTAPGPFHVGKAKTVSVPMMSTGAGRDLRVAVGQGPCALSRPDACPSSLDAALLPYAGGRFSALVLMPPLGQLARLEASLTPRSLGQVVRGLESQPAVVQLPRFSLASDLSLRGALSAMGMGQAFEPSADFSGLSPDPLRLGFVVHDAQIQVTEKGTEASAASGGGLTPTAVAPGKVLVFDHPFLYLVRDDTTGALLFEAQVRDPAAG